MKIPFLLRLLPICGICGHSLFAATPIKDLKVSGASEITSGTFSIQTGVTVTAGSGSTLDLTLGDLIFEDGQLPWIAINKTGAIMVGVGASSAAGLVPNPGASGTATDYLARDATFKTLPAAPSNFGASGASSSSGLVPAPGATAGTTRALFEDGTWKIPATGATSVFGASGASSSSGLVPNPGVTAGTTRYLREDATWQVNGAGTIATTSAPLKGDGAGNASAGNPATLAFATSAIAASAIDWTVAQTFSKTLGANTTFTFSGAADGQTIVVAVTNTASNYTVTWPTVSWSGGAAPTQTVGAKTDVYTFAKIGSVIYGSAVQNF